MDNIDINQLVDTYIIPWGINIAFAVAILLLGRWIVSIIANIVSGLLNKSRMEVILVNFITSILRTVLFLFVIIAAMDKLGVNTTSLVALLGAAGLAVGLALQGSLQNFAAGVMLIVFRPFKSGDFIEAAGISGTVEIINIFSSTLRTGDNREIIVPNGSIYGGVITNFSARSTRRIDMIVGIGYDSDLKLARQTLEEIINADERILKDPATLIAVSELAESSVNLVLRPWVKSSDYWAVKFDLNEKIKLSFDDKNIAIPYPQMDIHIEKMVS